MKKICPDRPRKRETPKDEAEVASEICFDGVDATSSGRAGVKENACVYGRGHGHGQGCKRPADGG